MRGSIFHLRAKGPGDSRIVPVTAGYSWQPGAESRTPSNTCSKLSRVQWCLGCGVKCANDLSCESPMDQRGKNGKPVMLSADTPASIVASSLHYEVHHGDNRHKCIRTW
ncbi:hypothetical protein PIB30_037143 [Stylosanthes scabra]|uniref:Uncharacterized protein n=1 Tax=Stylosanthes scabra TaxID=79078 RepID=A0ABU6RE74_9FABA|nr:hypothetical protein [Stylosanthes scabra]